MVRLAHGRRAALVAALALAGLAGAAGCGTALPALEKHLKMLQAVAASG